MVEVVEARATVTVMRLVMLGQGIPATLVTAQVTQENNYAHFFKEK
jgi:hypothetical protein